MREEFEPPLIKFVKKRMREEVREVEIYDATEMIMMSLREAYFRYAIGDDDQAYGNEQWAKQLYEHYNVIYGNEKVRRVDLASFDMLKYMALRDFLRDPFYPPNMKNALRNRIKAERPDLYEKLTLSEAEYMEHLEKLQEEEKPQDQE